MIVALCFFLNLNSFHNVAILPCLRLVEFYSKRQFFFPKLDAILFSSTSLNSISVYTIDVLSEKAKLYRPMLCFRFKDFFQKSISISNEHRGLMNKKVGMNDTQCWHFYSTQKVSNI